ncbi:twin-arginine translocation signal domain-containing protein [Halomicroarcula sp. S1AR25-4]|uniref:twin-arginine translocation signal domain-containing protein n=1 Tax=Haloarcula sp. S1AR25-4 TaxID=2950538 RepID=UPI0028743969|nr:twin-arginine translocation signal domain-containing protein [Halomicroarcula sp. S1AR25-4]MDS0279994.1 twin-arginine translocation signal domain-containing protein [Halomicroarcula sp. S1AR25-4]
MTETPTDDQTPALAFEGTYAYDTPEAGTVALTGRTQCPGAVGLTTNGIAVGPVEISPYPSSTAVIRDLSYGAEDGGFFGGWGEDSDETDGEDDSFFSGLATALGITGAGGSLAADRDAESPDTSRRDFIRALGAGAGLAVVGGEVADRVAAQTDTVSVANFELQFPAGVSARIRDLGPGYLPTDGLYYVLIDGMDYAETQGGTEQQADIPPDPRDTFRDVEIATDAGSILAGAKATLGKKALDYEFTLSDSPTAVSQGTLLTLSDHPLLVAATLRSGPDATTLDIGDEAVPHQNEADDAPEGYYYVHEGAVVYRVGPDPPSDTAAAFTIYAGKLGETTNDIAQQY